MSAIVRVLMKRGCNYGLKNKNGNTANDIAIEKNLSNVVAAIFSNKSKVIHPLSKHILFLILLSCTILFKAIVIISLYCKECFFDLNVQRNRNSTDSNTTSPTNKTEAYTYTYYYSDVKKGDKFSYTTRYKPYNISTPLSISKTNFKCLIKEDDCSIEGSLFYFSFIVDLLNCLVILYFKLFYFAGARDKRKVSSEIVSFIVYYFINIIQYHMLTLKLLLILASSFGNFRKLLC